MKAYQSLSQTRRDCKYRVVFIAKHGKKRIFGVLQRLLGEILRELSGCKESRILERHLMREHVHMCISIPPKYAVSNVVECLKGDSAIQMARKYADRRRDFAGNNFRARDCCVSTVGLDDAIQHRCPGMAGLRLGLSVSRLFYEPVPQALGMELL